MDLRAGPQVMLIQLCPCGVLDRIEPLPIDDLKKGLNILRPAIPIFRISLKTMRDFKKIKEQKMKPIWLVAGLILFFSGTALAADGMINVQSSYNAQETADRLDPFV
jgi:hypothetical protein